MGLKNYKYIKELNIRTTDDSIMEDIENFRSRRKLFRNMNLFFSLAGKFENEVYFNQYELKENYSKCYALDLDGNIFIFYLYNTDSNEYGIIEKVSNDGSLKYDLKLLKDNELTEDNLSMCKYDEQYDFKYGRLVTDGKSFISVFLAKDVCFQVLFKTNNIFDIKMLLQELNKVSGEFTFKKFIDIIGSYMSDCDFTFKVFEKFSSIGEFDFKKKEHNKEKSIGNNTKNSMFS